MAMMEAVINSREVRFNPESGEIFMQNRHFKDQRWEVKTPCSNGKGYHCIHIGNKKYYIHRLIYKFYNPDWGIDDGSIKNNSIDHINGTTTDNRIENLRNVTNQKNCFNRTKAKGYHWHKSKKKWQAYIKLNGKRIHLGYFVLEADARDAYLAAKLIHHII